ncbi:MAG TPA: hypothetical protein VJ597_00950 [Sphingomicrobium sp.]|nr:hypothetical protein [Sphingomicrobium sp.]
MAAPQNTPPETTSIRRLGHERLKEDDISKLTFVHLDRLVVIGHGRSARRAHNRFQ